MTKTKAQPAPKITLRRDRAVSYARSVRDATAAIAAQVRTRSVERPKKATTTLEVLNAYVAELRKNGQDAESVESAVGCWLAPALGHLAPEDCDAAHLSILIDVMREAGRAANTIRTRCAFVKSAMTFAVRARLIDRHPLPSLRGVLPKKRTRTGFSARREILSVLSLEKLTCSPRVPHRERVQYLVAATCGLRVGEIVELRLADIDREAKLVSEDGATSDGAALHVTRQWKRKKKKIGPPKGGGPRTIALRPDVLAVLDRWIDVGWPRRYGRAAQPDDLLFPADEPDGARDLSKLGTRHQDDRKVLERLHGNLEAVGLAKRRQHAFRHTFVSLLVDAGVAKDVAEQFCHPSPCASIDVYAHYSYRLLHESVRRVPLRLREPTEQLELFAADALSPRNRHPSLAAQKET